MCAALGLAPSTMHGYLNESREPKLSFFVKFAEIYPDIDIYWLITGSGEMVKIGHVKYEVLEKELASANLTIALYQKLDVVNEEKEKVSEDKDLLIKILEQNQQLIASLKGGRKQHVKIDSGAEK